MKSIVETLRELGIAEEDYVYLNYEDVASIWHISDDYISTALADTSTATILASLLATPGITIWSRYEEDILGSMRDEGLLEDYDRGGAFEEYLVEAIIEHAYEYNLLTISTERHDHKRGSCEVAANVKVRAGELYALNDDADSFVAGFDVVVQTQNGLLTINKYELD